LAEEEPKAADVAGEEDPNKPLIVTLGDYVMRQGSFGSGIVTSSADSGWISRLAAAYSDKAQIVNKGQATATSADGVTMVRDLLTDYPDAGERIKLVVLSFGGNDAITRSSGENDTPAKVAMADYENNIKTMVADLRKAGVNNILLVTPPPAARRTDRRFKTIKEYAHAASEVGKSMDVPVVDLFAAVASLQNWQASALNDDGLRLSERGQQLLFKRVMKVLGSKLQTVSPSKLQPATQ
jgi:lysophospholipase L1-like esterase